MDVIRAEYLYLCLSTNKCLFTAFMGQHNKINLRPSRKCRQLSISSLQTTILRLCICALCCDVTLRSSFPTCTSRGSVTVVARYRLKTIQCWYLVLHFVRMVLLFSRLFMEQYLCFNGAKKLSDRKHFLVSLLRREFNKA